MSLKGTKTTADFLPWHDVLALIQRLEREQKNELAMLVACGAYTGLRISDLLKLTWKQIIQQQHIQIVEQKTKKVRQIKLNSEFKEIAERLFTKCRVLNASEPVFLNPSTKQVFTVQHFNRAFKSLKHKYRLAVKSFSTHSLRKTFGRHIWENSGFSDRAITMLSEIFNHSSFKITRRYLGINSDEIEQIYDLL